MTVKTSLQTGSKAGRVLTATALALVFGAGLSACSTISNLNPLKKDEPEEVATQGERISIVAFEQKVQPSERLAGKDFYLPSPQPVADWPFASGPIGAGVEHAAAAEQFKVAWSKSVGAGSSRTAQVVASPVSDGKFIYAMDGEARIRAFDVNTGNEAWTRDLNPDIRRDKDAFGGGLAVSGGKLYVTSGFRLAAALDAASGEVLWTKTFDSPVRAAPAVNGNVVVFSDVDNQMIALNKETGEPAWTYQAIVEPARILRTTSPAVYEGLFIAPFSSGELIGIDANSGQQVWTQTLAQSSRTNALSEIRDISGRPLIANGLVYAASHSGVFSAMDAKSGQRRWSVNADSTNAPWVAGDAVYLSTLQSELMAANANSGQVYWLVDLNQGRNKTKKSFFGLGSEKKNKNLPVWTGPILASNRLIMVNSEGEMVAFDPKTGERKDTLKLGDAAYLAPIVVGDKLFVLTDKAKLVAVQ
ncbi:PQQ-binding-like beta-propeller repeat protein [Asticcacaulis sp. AND118]|uniref:PQQ-binding-like beta-propeller repeat protein n=1 Tax=Asticcacaulis sp. AND118 TaxID=2840468 RepID=UPI001CFFCADA|nr:PQQ-binding-like beta-propeller repeat protein [Asticcacaulis sp. AND118]UDF02506.1 PQQ-like beta-propeller repeat protein [Asticcacaulis sp. AND118]